MPVKSAKQFRFMEMMANNLKKKKKMGMSGQSISGPSPEVAQEFLDKTPEKKKSLFAKAKR